MLEPNLSDGQVYVPGRGEDKARELYELAQKKGVDYAEVSTTSHGYIVPEGLLDDDSDAVRRSDQPAVPTEPGTTKNPKEAWNAEAGQVYEEELQKLSDDEATEKRVADANATQREAEEKADEDGQYDPTSHSVAEVKEYLESADEQERQRVLDAEANSDKPRKGLLKEGDK